MPGEENRVDVVIPLQDEETSVTDLMESLACQSRQPDAVLIVDAGSRDRTAELVSAFRAPFPVRLIPAGRLFPGEARNLGVAASNHEWIAFTDGGIRAEPEWLARLMARAGAETDVVFGSYTPVCDSLWTEASAIAYVAPPAAWGGRGPFVASLAIRRRAFGQSGGFPSHRAAEDLIWLERLASLGVRFAYAPDALVRWQTASNPAATYRRFALYSHHNLAAGRGRFWHAGLARLYGVLVLAMVVLTLLGGIRLGLAALPAFLLARAFKAAWQRRGSLPFETLAPHRVLGAGLVLAIVDVATFAGVLRWIRCRQPARGA